jgi:cadmium resistance transport/sequestration family protein
MELLITSIIAFASTNIDDIFILMLFFANKEYQTKQVILGQYLGIVALILISLIGSLIGLLFDQKYIGLLGLLPIYFGIRSIIKLFQNKRESEQEETRLDTRKSNKTFSVAAVTFANGGDNIGIYIPLFATLLIHQKAIMISIFLVMVAVWCLVAWYLSKHRTIARTIEKYGHIITPIVLILLGIYILYESDTFELI